MPLNAIETEHLVKLEKIEDTLFNWQQITPHPMKENIFYVFSKQGKVSQITQGKAAEIPLLYLPSALKQENIIQSALALHPNFSLKDLAGYQTFYTAHQEAFNTNGRLVRLPKVPIENSQVDLVINEWQLTANGDKTDLDSKREILRIASPDATAFIHQLSFNPYLKPWQEGFGALFVTLNHVEEYTNTPLFSGAVLRINPEKFGLRNYTIPNENPFNNNADIDNEIIALGAKNIHKILWQKKNNQQWFALSKQENQQALVLINNGDDLRKETVKPLWQTSLLTDLDQIIWYEGRQLTGLLYKLIFLNFSDKQWQLNSLTVAEDKTVAEVSLANIPNTDQNTTLGLMTDSNAELILLNRTDGIFSKLKSITDNESNRNETSNQDSYSAPYESSNNNIIYILISFAVLVILAIFTLKKIMSYDKEKAQVKKQFARFELSHHGDKIDLFKRHQKESSLTLKLKDIKASKVKLNHQVINIINNEIDNVFDENAKAKMQHTFTLEHRLKMIENRARVISIELVDIHNKSHHICLYARRGSQRYTRTDYQECLNITFAWCRDISAAINPHHVDSNTSI